MYRLKEIMLLLLLSVPVYAGAQQHDFGGELAATVGFKPWRGGSLTVGEKVRFIDGCTRFSQSKTSLVVQHSLLRSELKRYDLRWRVGGGYTFIDRLSDAYSNPYYEYQHRLMLQSTLAWRYGLWRFAGRLRAQSTFRDEQRGDYRYNPKIALRARLSATYAFPDRPWKLGANSELFYRANDPRGAFVDEWRTTVEATYLFDRSSSLTLYGKYFHELQVDNPLRMFCLGLRYDFE